VIGLMMTMIAAPGPDVVGDPSARLRDLFEDEWQQRLADDPMMASRLGDARFGDRWPDLSPEAIAKREAREKDVLARLATIPTSGLSASARLDADIFRRRYELAVTEQHFKGHLLPLNHMEGIQSLTQEIISFPFRDLRDYENWLARLKTFPLFMDQTIALMKEGIKTRILHPRVIMERVPEQIAAQIVEDPAKSPFFEPFTRFPETIEAADPGRLADEAKRPVAQDLGPAYRSLAAFFEAEYLPACPSEIGASHRPLGAEWYAALARRYTTTDLTPAQIHEIGQKEVARIRAAMETTKNAAGFDGSFAEFLTFLRTDSRFHYSDPNELLLQYRALSRRIDPGLVKLFKTLPRTPYGVEPIPDDIAPDTTTAYYRQPAADGSRAGTYFVNLYKPEVRPIYEMEALSLHEAVPGHHFQIALAMERDNVPSFRRYDDVTAFVEGWGLYAESLGEDLGFYKDPYSKFGQLTYEMWRAVRLVVDTGMHSMGWTRQQAIDFFVSNAAKTEHDIVNEIDRYIAWPGQALAYKIGELKIKELRARAEAALGPRFDVREFHDVVLLEGAVPLDVLASRVDAWIAAQSR